MTVLTPDTDLSTDLMFVTPELTAEQQLVKLSVVVSSEQADSLYLNGEQLNVSYDRLYYSEIKYFDNCVYFHLFYLTKNALF